VVEHPLERVRYLLPVAGLRRQLIREHIPVGARLDLVRLQEPLGRGEALVGHSLARAFGQVLEQIEPVAWDRSA
jgi:hypothetical protein